MDKSRPFNINKWLVVAAYKAVKRSKGSAGVDEETIEDFERNLKNNLYKVWNRMSSGSYFPPPLRTVEIPKKSGGYRRLGIPTVSDRVAQMVVKMVLEPRVDQIFHVDSYGYRPNKAALDAVGKARIRNRVCDWVVDVDIKGFFDNINHEIMMKMVKHHAQEKWILLYVERWLKNEVLSADGKTTKREKGIAQGSVISPLLANIYLHYVFDTWMAREFPKVLWERYADDIIVHCKSWKQAKYIRHRISKQMEVYGLELHLEKTKISYNRDYRRRQRYKHQKYEFLGYEFRPRQARSNRGYFVVFTPAISPKSAKKIRETIRGWRLGRRTNWELEDIAKLVNPKVRGWYNYYGRYNKSVCKNVLISVQYHLKKWVKRKHKKVSTNKRRIQRWIDTVREHNPKQFFHWEIGIVY